MKKDDPTKIRLLSEAQEMLNDLYSVGLTVREKVSADLESVNNQNKSKKINK
ncbi:MAG: hypothetical protein DHS20C10_04800 [marine bacterium B5-7]|nr:MAG: hypothetical protein DHS20C10_04800 [marine bacterium B5-7]